MNFIEAIKKTTESIRDWAKGKFISSPVSAKVGQALVVQKVDEKGVPTSWESKDFPEGSVKTVNGVEPDENGNIVVQAGVQPDWNQNDTKAADYVKNRTHWVESFPPITWDMSTEGRDTVDATSIGMGVFVKISDDVWDLEQCQKSRITDGVNDAGGYQSVLISDDQVGIVFCMSFFSDTANVVVLSAVSAVDLTDSYGIVIPSAGIYIYWDNTYEPAKITLSTVDRFHTLDKNFLPDGVATKEYVDRLENTIPAGSYLQVNLDGSETVFAFNQSSEEMKAMFNRQEMRVNLQLSSGVDVYRSVLCHFEQINANSTNRYIATHIDTVCSDGEFSMENAKTYVIYLVVDFSGCTVTTYAKELSFAIEATV